MTPTMKLMRYFVCAADDGLAWLFFCELHPESMKPSRDFCFRNQN